MIRATDTGTGHLDACTALGSSAVSRGARALMSIQPEYRQEIEDCFKSMSPSVYRYLYRLTLKDEQLSEDLVQETFRKGAEIWHELRDLTAEKRLAWLKRVAFNTATDVFRHEETA